MPWSAEAGSGAIIGQFDTILENSPAMKEAGFVSCADSPADVPAPKIKVNGSLFESKMRIERDEAARFSAEMGDTHWHYVWFVFGPPHLLGDPLAPTIGQEFNYSPMTFGDHQLVLVAQNNEAQCVAADRSFFATVNRPLPSSVPPADFALPSMPWAEQIQKEEAQAASRGEGITVAVIGTGIDYLHPELHDSIWSKACSQERQSRCEIPDNGADDDDNGFIDDAYGWDFRENDPYPFDYQFHETGVAGFIVAKRFGVAPAAKLMILKTGANAAALRDMGKAIRYAVHEGAKIINISTGFFKNDLDGGPQVIADIQSAVNEAEAYGVVIVASAGNGRTNRAADIDHDPFYPSSFTNANIVSVAAVNRRGKRASYSNYGKETVDVAAPGGELPAGIMMLTPSVPGKSPFVKTQGTSFAAPIVSGAIALALSARPERYMTADGKVKFDVLHRYLNQSGQKVESLAPLVKSGRVLSASALVR